MKPTCYPFKIQYNHYFTATDIRESCELRDVCNTLLSDKPKLRIGIYINVHLEIVNLLIL